MTQLVQKIQVFFRFDNLYKQFIQDFSQIVMPFISILGKIETESTLIIDNISKKDNSNSNDGN